MQLAVAGSREHRRRLQAPHLGRGLAPDEEHDELDEAPCTYVLNADENGNVVAGSRLIPTTQPTFLMTYFPELVPPGMDFCSPTIWESSKYCTANDSDSSRIRSGQKKSAVDHIAGGVEYGVANGITHYIAVVEERLYRLTRMFYPKADILGQQEINGEPVVCAIWPLEEDCLRITRYVSSIT